MSSLRLLAVLILIFSAPSAFAKGGDKIRDDAPVTALILDAREGNTKPLLKAYFEDELDFFLDYEAPQSDILRHLFNLRETGKQIEAGDFFGAESRLRSIQGFENERLYLKGVLDAAQGKHELALESFRRLIDGRNKLSRHLASLAFMGAARVFHEIADYKQAIYHYNQVRQLDPEFFEAVFEKSWSFYLEGDMNGALGATLTFASPFFKNAFFPEAFVVRAAAFYQLCYYDRATLTIERMKKDYAPIRAQIADLRNSNPENWLLDDSKTYLMDPRLRGFMVSDRGFRRTMRAYLALKKEARKGDLSTKAYGFIRQRLAQEARRVLEKADRNLSNIIAQADTIQIEILQSAANQLLGIKTESASPSKKMDLGSVDFDSLVQFWPFKGEFWVDELGSYYYGLKSSCSS